PRHAGRQMAEKARGLTVALRRVARRRSDHHVARLPELRNVADHLHAPATALAPGQTPFQCEVERLVEGHRLSLRPRLVKCRLAERRSEAGDAWRGIGPDLALERLGARFPKGTRRSVEMSGATSSTEGGGEPGGEIEDHRCSISMSAPSEEAEALVEQGLRSLAVVLFERHEGKARGRAQDSPCVVEAAIDREALVEQLAGAWVLPSTHGDSPQSLCPVADAADVSQLARSTHALLECTLCGVKLPLNTEHRAEMRQRIHLARRV